MESFLKRTRSVSPVMENTDDSSSPNSLSPLVAANVTHRSHSVELFETIDSNNKLSNKKRKVKPSHESVGNKKADSRQQRHKKETKKAQRDGVKKKRLEALDQAEKAIKDGSHDQYHQLLDDVESKRTRMLHIIQARRTSTENSITRFFTSQKDIAYSQYYWDKLSLRHAMIQRVQHQISQLEHEYYSSHIQNNEEHLMDWSPPDRPTMISSLTMGLSDEVAESDLQLAKQPPSLTQDPSRESSPPLDMLASLADHRYQRDFKH